MKRDKVLGGKGNKNYSWKGGRRIEKRGYVMIWLTPNDPFYAMANKAHYIREHRLVMAKHLGRSLSPLEIIHHINRIKGDNRLENLKLTTQCGHREDAMELAKQEEQARLLRYLKSLLKVNPKASLAATIDLMETTGERSYE